MLIRRSLLLASLALLVASQTPLLAADPPAYQIVLRSRSAEVKPNRTNDAQTGGGWIYVEQPEPHTIVVTMGGSAAAGSDLHSAMAEIDFELNQDLEIKPTRAGVRPPRIGLVARLVGTLQATAAGKHCSSCGTAEQTTAMACLSSDKTNLVNVSIKPSSVACGQELSINHREGPVESPIAPGNFRLHGTFHIGVTQGKGVFNRQYAVADFDPAPQLDAFWADALRPFRAVPRKDFGFKIVLRVVEDTQAGGN